MGERDANNSHLVSTTNAILVLCSTGQVMWSLFLFLGISVYIETLCSNVPRRLEGPLTPCLGTSVLLITLMVTAKTVISMMIWSVMDVESTVFMVTIMTS